MGWLFHVKEGLKISQYRQRIIESKLADVSIKSVDSRCISLNMLKLIKIPVRTAATRRPRSLVVVQ